MRRSSTTAQLRALARNRTTVKVVGASTAAALIAAAFAGGAGSAIAAPDAHSMVDAALYAQSVAAAGTPNAPSADALKVTVGKAVSITTDATGEPNLIALVSNTQVSGKGRGTVKVPIGNPSAVNTGIFGNPSVVSDSIVYDVNSTTPEVQNLHASGGMYAGKPAVSLKIQAWLDGKSISANDLVNVTGNVKINYVFTNETAVDTPLTYKNAAGATVTQTLPIPAPLGAAFKTVFPNGWGNIVAPWADSGISPTGQQLSGTIILFPLGPVGGVTQTQTVTARAENATFPFSTTSAIPVDLASELGAAASLPGAAASALGDVSQLLSTAPQQLLFYQRLLQKYSTIVADLDNQYVKPLVSTVNGINVTPKQLKTVVNVAELGVDAAALYMRLNGLVAQANAFIAGVGADLLRDGAPIAEDIALVLNGLAETLEGLGGPNGPMQEGINTLTGLIKEAGGNAALNNNLQSILGVWGQPCSSMAATNTSYNAAAKGALTSGIAGLSSGKPKTAAQDTQTALNAQDSLDGVIQPCNDQMTTIEFIIATLIGDGTPASGLVGLLTNLEATLEGLGSPQGPVANAAGLVSAIGETLPGYANQLDHNSGCPNTMASPSANRQNCGAKQLFGLVAAANNAVAKGLTADVVPAIDGLKKYIPTVENLLKTVKSLVNLIGGAVAGAPGLLETFAKDIGGVIPTVEGIGALTTSLADKLAILNAAIEAMTKMGAAGAAVPYGNATGPPGTNTIAAWQINQNGANANNSQDMLNLVLALIMFLVAGAAGTVMYRKHRLN